MLVVRGRREISSTPLYKVSKVEEGTSSSGEELGQARDPMADARTIIGIFERYRSG